MRMRRGGFGLVIVMLATPVGAQQSEADKLFDEATVLMKQNKYAEACPKFAASNKLDPEVGGLLWLADCYERNNQTASAYRTYQDALKLAVDRKDKQHREKVAQKHLDSLDAHLTKLLVAVPPERPADLQVTRDGEPLATEAFGVATAVDPGSHTVSATASHFKRFEQKVDVTGEGQTVTVTVALEKEYVAPPPPKVEEGDPGYPFKVGGVITASVGLVALAVGSVFGLVAAGKLSDSNANGHCDAMDTCDAVGLGLRSDAKDAALASTILFIGGGVAVVGGVILFVAAPKKKTMGPILGHVTPWLGGGLYGAGFTTRF